MSGLEKAISCHSSIIQSKMELRCAPALGTGVGVGGKGQKPIGAN